MAYIKLFKDQNWLLPPNRSDLIPDDHVCLLIESFIGELDFSSFDIKYSGAGHPAYHPRIILKLLVMGVFDKVRSSRRLARNARGNMVYMYLSEKLCPDFRTISDFRKDNSEIVKRAFQHTLALANSEGMLDLSNLATDGTKLKANASNRKVLSKEAKEVYKLRKQIVEFVFGDFRENKGRVTFLTRSLETVRTEFNWMGLASNLYKIWRKKLEKIEKIKRDIRLDIKKIFVIYVCDR